MDLNKRKILIVDDEKPLQEMITDVLSLADFEVVTADDGVQGLKKIYDDSPDLIILDCEMPNMDGYELLTKIRSDPMLLNKPVIMLTVRNTEFDEIKGLKLGIDDFMTKPFKPSVLLARVKTVLERKALSLGANPLTLLAGNIAITFEIERRITAEAPFSLMYIDINNFKSFNDRYGFERGDKIIKHLASILIRVTRENGSQNDFVGHIGGDDFIVISASDVYNKICERTIQLFDESVPEFYDLLDRTQGYIMTEDRQGKIQKFPLMTLSIGVISTTHTKITRYAQLSEIAASLKKIAKTYNHSAFIVERRKE
jgi:diguanylate cyclase (GGDEF)-like protein